MEFENNLNNYYLKNFGNKLDETKDLVENRVNQILVNASSLRKDFESELKHIANEYPDILHLGLSMEEFKSLQVIAYSISCMLPKSIRGIPWSSQEIEKSEQLLDLVDQPELLRLIVDYYIGGNKSTDKLENFLHSSFKTWCLKCMNGMKLKKSLNQVQQNHLYWKSFSNKIGFSGKDNIAKTGKKRKRQSKLAKKYPSAFLLARIAFRQDSTDDNSLTIEEISKFDYMEILQINQEIGSKLIPKVYPKEKTPFTEFLNQISCVKLLALMYIIEFKLGSQWHSMYQYLENKLKKIKPPPVYHIEECIIHPSAELLLASPKIISGDRFKITSKKININVPGTIDVKDGREIELNMCIYSFDKNYQLVNLQDDFNKIDLNQLNPNSKYLAVVTTLSNQTYFEDLEEEITLEVTNGNQQMDFQISSSENTTNLSIVFDLTKDVIIWCDLGILIGDLTNQLNEILTRKNKIPTFAWVAKKLYTQSKKKVDSDSKRCLFIGNPNEQNLPNKSVIISKGIDLADKPYEIRTNIWSIATRPIVEDLIDFGKTGIVKRLGYDFKVLETPMDGDCLFHAVISQVEPNICDNKVPKEIINKVRKIILDEIVKNSTEEKSKNLLIYLKMDWKENAEPLLYSSSDDSDDLYEDSNEESNEEIPNWLNFKTMSVSEKFKLLSSGDTDSEDGEQSDDEFDINSELSNNDNYQVFEVDEDADNDEEIDGGNDEEIDAGNDEEIDESPLEEMDEQSLVDYYYKIMTDEEFCKTNKLPNCCRWGSHFELEELAKHYKVRIGVITANQPWIRNYPLVDNGESSSQLFIYYDGSHYSIAKQIIKN